MKILSIVSTAWDCIGEAYARLGEGWAQIKNTFCATTRFCKVEQKPLPQPTRKPQALFNPAFHEILKSLPKGYKDLLDQEGRRRYEEILPEQLEKLLPPGFSKTNSQLNEGLRKYLREMQSDPLGKKSHLSRVEKILRRIELQGQIIDR